MARTQAPHSATAQFFINVANQRHQATPAKSARLGLLRLCGDHAEGMDVVDKIKGVATGRSGMHQDVPKDVIVKT